MPPTAGITPHAIHPDSTTRANDFMERIRSQRACAMCHRKKTKCEVDGSNRICVPCARRHTECIFPTSDDTEQDDSSDQYVRFLKDRLERVESLLRTAGILQDGNMGHYLSDVEEDDDFGEDRQADQRPKSAGHASTLSSASGASPDHSGTACFRGGGDLEVGSIFRAHESDDSRYFGRSCSLSILSRGGIEWIKSKTGDTSFLNIVSPDSIHDSPWNQWRPDVFHDLFASQVYKALPPRSEVFSLIKDFFGLRIASIWASINMVICLAYEFRFSNSLKPEKDREKARLYFKNAMSVFTELALRRTDLLSVQALLSMGFFLRGNSGTQAALPFITAAMRSCQRMGLHRDMARPDLSPAEQEQRRRVFWVAFTVDQSTCLRAGNAPSQHPDDFDVPLPQQTEDDHDPEMSSNILFFRQLCQMALIKTRIYCRLYAAKALLKPPDETYQTVKELHSELEEWRKDYPFTEEPKRKAAESEFLFGFASIGLHFIYYNALIMIHRIPLVLNYLISSRDEPEEMKALSRAQAAKSGVICVQAARDTLSMVNNMPWGDIAWVWSLLYYVFLAAATIFSNIIRDTRSPQVQSDLKSLNMAATFFATLVPGDETANYAGFMTRMSATLERIARIAIAKDEKRARSPDEQDDHDPPGPKRLHSHAAPASHARSQLRPSTRRKPLSNTTSSFSRTTASAPQSHMPNFGIPESIEGLPPINSSGYVVPLSPEGTNDFDPTTSSQVPRSGTNYTPGLGLNDLNGMNVTSSTAFSTPNIPTWQLPQDQQYSTTQSSPLDTTQSPYSQSSSTGTNTMIPDSWQVPLTADWQFGDELWSGLFPSEAMAASAQTQPVSFPILSAESYLNYPGSAPDPSIPTTADSGGMGYTPQSMGYDYAPSMLQDPNLMHQNQTQPQSQPQAQNQDSWPEGFMSLF
ncbi:hypothetical protein N7512_001451 [Penicillium capsulatum]|nr:hypothetical protein N7512_001451 [Penicillium capsulatum]